MTYTSRDGLMQSSDPAAVELWESISERHATAKGSWTKRLRAMGVKLAHPDDGWVTRDRNEFSMSWYPQFDDRPEVGDLIAFGCPPSGEHYRRARSYDEKYRNVAYDRRPVTDPEYAIEGYRICRVTSVERRSSILGYLQDFEYEDTGVRVPPAKPEPVHVSWWRRFTRPRPRAGHEEAGMKVELTDAEREKLAEPIYDAYRLGKYGKQEYIPMWHELATRPTENFEAERVYAAVESIMAARCAGALRDAADRGPTRYGPTQRLITTLGERVSRYREPESWPDALRALADEYAPESNEHPFDAPRGQRMPDRATPANADQPIRSGHCCETCRREERS